MNEINSWAEKETNGLIKEILPPEFVDQSTDIRLIIADAFHFRAEWDEKFETDHTEDYDFHLLDKTSVKKQKRQSKGKKDDPDSDKMEKVDTDRLVVVPIGDKAVDKISLSGA
ncbi:hypothetical protein RIF29_22078 [Crotalaria pallida]|uniref:Serpin domain-containing protein n=1 Tax=Crotalaria pallida TaxID=3830 RepID=A0AAN9F8K5_CROPI